MSVDEILTLAPTTPISAVGNVELTVNEFRRLLSPIDQNSSNESRFLNEEIIWAAVTKLEPLPDHKHVLLPFLSKDLKDKSIDDILARYVHEYLLRVEGYNLIVIPLLYAKHWTLMVVYPNAKLIEFFDSFHYKQTPHQLFFTCKLFIEILLDCKFEITYRKDIPSQFNSYDCGMYIIKFAEHAITGIPLDFKDTEMNSFRLSLAAKFRILPAEVDKDLRESDDMITDEDSNDEDLEDKVDADDGIAVDISNDVASCSIQAKPSYNYLSNSMKKCSIKKHKDFGVFSYQESIEWENKTDKPYLGRNFYGQTITYNANGDWRKMLNFLEILNHFDSDHKKALNMIAEEIRKDPKVAIDWNNNSICHKASPFNFRWFHRGNFQKIKTVLSNMGIILVNHQLKKINALRNKRKSKKSKNRYIY